MIEPPKYRIGPDGGLQTTKEWQDWRKQVLSNGFEKHNKSKKTTAKKMPPKKMDAEKHQFNWREVASSPSGRKVFFCACQSSTGEKYAGCGATAVQSGRGGQKEIVIPPRFE